MPRLRRAARRMAHTLQVLPLPRVHSAGSGDIWLFVVTQSALMAWWSAPQCSSEPQQSRGAVDDPRDVRGHGDRISVDAGLLPDSWILAWLRVCYWDDASVVGKS